MTVQDVLTSSWNHNDRPRAFPPSAIMLANAGDLCARVNTFLAAFYASKSPNQPQRSVVSGYRPAVINAGIPGARAGDAHETCEAVDIEDGDGELAAYCMANLGAMKTVGLCMEDPRWTRTIGPNQSKTISFQHGWVHLQNKPVPSGNTVFIPYPGEPP